MIERQMSMGGDAKDNGAEEQQYAWPAQTWVRDEEWERQKCPFPWSSDCVVVESIRSAKTGRDL